MIYNKIKEKLYIIFYIFIFVTVTEYVYVEYVSVTFSYMRMYYEPNYIKFVEAKLLVVFVSFLVPVKISKPSDILFAWFILFPIVPIISLYWLSNESRLFVYVIIICVYLMSILKNTSYIRIKRINKNEYYGLVISIVFTLIAISWFIISGAINSFNLNFDRVYEFRRDVGKTLSAGYMGYISAWAYKVFSIYLLAFAFYKQKKIIFALLVFLQIFYFGVTSHKSVVFFPVIILLLYLLFNRSNKSYKLFFSISLGVFLMAILFIQFGDERLLSLGFRRALFTLARNHFDYYDLFTQIDHIYMANSLLSPFFEYPYQESPFFMVGAIYDSNDTSYNVGYLATSFMHFSYVGMIVFTVIIAQIMAFVDYLTKVNSIPNWFAAALVIIPFNALFTSSELTITLVTHGLAISIFLLWISNLKSKIMIKI